MIHLKSKEEIAKLHRAADLVSRTLGMFAGEIKPGVSTLQLDTLAEEFIRDNGATPSFKGLYGFPNACCISPNAQVVHGFPSKDPIKEGDIISIDCGACIDGYHGDQAFTFAVGEIDPRTARLLKVTRESIYKGLSQVKAGNRIGDIGHAVQRYCEGYGYGVVRDLCGHGIGKKVHEDPQVPNYGSAHKGELIEEGMVLAVEPMINMGTYRVRQLKDGWTILTNDMKPSAHFEHDVAVVDGRPVLLSTYKYIDMAQGVTSDEEKPFEYNWE
ncbi:MAG: type I methionyl aminopeptidase [Flavobacteriales bacterium]|nr:type I methionyl aminopeptidase [Flavobacteriales bacterium]